MPDRYRCTVVLENDQGDRREIETVAAGKTTCPDCNSENINFHSLTRVLAGECGSCFTTWTIGVDNEWEVVSEDGG